MEFKKRLVPGIFIKRYKRFLVDVELSTGEIVVAHTTNSGSMKTCIEQGAEVYLSPATNLNRKTKFTWEMIKTHNHWIGVNTLVPNLLAFEAIKNNEIPQLSGYTYVKREVKYGDSRFDVYCEKSNEKCFVEVKNVTMKVGDSALFPDAITTRGQKHLNTLVEVKQAGIRAVMLYVIQRTDVNSFGMATDIDAEYSKALRRAINSGVEVIAMQADVSPKGICFIKQLPLVIE